jgi:carboxyl-terminal processing protease
MKEDPALLKERDLKKHLEGELAKIKVDMKSVDEKDENKIKSTDMNASEENNETIVDDTIITEEQLYKDAQLKSAVDILKALIITNKGNR